MWHNLESIDPPVFWGINPDRNHPGSGPQRSLSNSRIVSSSFVLAEDLLTDREAFFKEAGPRVA
jgi:hypothetical protein